MRPRSTYQHSTMGKKNTNGHPPCANDGCKVKYQAKLFRKRSQKFCNSCQDHLGKTGELKVVNFSEKVRWRKVKLDPSAGLIKCGNETCSIYSNQEVFFRDTRDENLIVCNRCSRNTQHWGGELPVWRPDEDRLCCNENCGNTYSVHWRKRYVNERCCGEYFCNPYYAWFTNHNEMRPIEICAKEIKSCSNTHCSNFGFIK